ncbi:MAG: hypothetical protein Kow006_11600 [Gammaproteobacteria bacterium]
MPKLVKIVNGVAVREYPLDSDEIRIGRSPDNQIQLDDSTVSGSHARIQLLPSAYLEGLKDIWIEDTNSTNGTKINGRPITRERLKHGDVVGIGSHRLEFVDENNLGSETTRLLLNDTHD